MLADHTSYYHGAASSAVVNPVAAADRHGAVEAMNAANEAFSELLDDKAARHAIAAIRAIHPADFTEGVAMLIAQALATHISGSNFSHCKSAKAAVEWLEWAADELEGA